MIGVVVAGVLMSNILGVVDLTKINTLPELYNSLLALKKDVFEDNERIKIIHGNLTQTLELTKELLEVIDIPIFFCYSNTLIPMAD